ncbi:MAG: hypothetical protein AB1896_07670 [Thermodesulfobacteriota bacterium]
MKRLWLLLVVITMTGLGCVTGGVYRPADKVAALEVAFADPAWNGQKVPDGQQCRRFGGQGATPGLIVRNIPAGANAVILEFSDKNVAKMDHGCHGRIGYLIPPGTTEVALPPVPGHTFELPQGFFLVQAHCAPSWDKAGAYLPPARAAGATSTP